MFRKAGIIAGFVSLFVPSLSLLALADETTAEKKEEPPAWAGSEISLTHNVGLSTIDASIDQSYNPLLTQGISIDPRWRLSKKLVLSAHLGFETELTNSDVSTYEREPLVEDTYIQGAYALAKLPVKLGGSVGLRLTFPTSKSSISRETIFSIAPSITLNRTFELTSSISIQPFATFRPSFTLATSEVATTDAPYILGCANLDNCDEFTYGGSRSTWMTLNTMFGVNVGLPKRLSASVLVWFAHGFLYERAPTGIPGVDDDPEGSNVRETMIYNIELGWDATKHIRVAGGFQTINDQLTSDSQFETPFFNRWTQVFVRGTYVF